MKRVFIFLYGANYDTFNKLKPKLEEPIICADSGILLAQKLKYKPRELILIGDLDSVSNKSLEWCKKNNYKIIKHPENKDFTDGHLAIEYTCNKYGTNVGKMIIGGISDRLDHTLGNILPTVPFIKKGHKITLLGNMEVISLSCTEIKLTNCKNHIISLIPLNDVTIKNTIGLKWELKNEIIPPYQSRTLRNIAIKSTATINLTSGILMVVESWQHY